jgi:hypothetical protein
MTPATPRDAAEMYVSQGLVLVQIPHGSKAPQAKDWQRSGIDTLDKARAVFKIPHNIGLLHSLSNTACLDPDDIPLTYEVLATIGLEANDYLNADTPKIKSAKGIKPVFRMPKGLKLETKKLAFLYQEDGKRKAHTVFELRGAGGQDVLPPSLHPSGIHYEWLGGYPESYDDFLELPSELLNLWQNWDFYLPIMQSVSPYFKPTEKTRNINAETLDIIGRYNQSVDVANLLESYGYRGKGKRFIAPGSSTGLAGVVILEDEGKQVAYSHHGSDVLGDGHSHDAFDVMRLLECGGEFKEAMDKAREHLGLPVFEAKVTRQNVGHEFKQQATGKTSYQFTTVSGGELMSKDLPKIPDVVEGILPVGLTVFAGKPKMGKSWLMLHTANGGYALGKVKVQGGEALYLGLEDSERRLQSRLSIFGESIPNTLHLGTSLPRIDEGGLAYVSAWLEQHPNAKLVVMDTLARVRPRRIKGADPVEEDVSTGIQLQALAMKHNISLVMVHHLRKALADDPLDAVSGTTGLTGVADAVLVLMRPRGEKNAVLHITGRDVTEQSLALQFKPDEGMWLLVGEAEKDELSSEEHSSLEEAKAFLKTALEHGAVPAKALFKEAKAVGVSERTLKRAKQSLLVKSRRYGDVWLWFVSEAYEIAK